MKILHIIAGKDAPHCAVKLITNLQGLQIEQCVLTERCQPFCADLEKNGVSLSTFPLAMPFVWLQKIMIRSFFARENPDIIHCWTARSATLLEKSAKGARPVILGWLSVADELPSYAACDKLLGMSKNVVQSLIKKGVLATRAYYIPIFTEISAAPPIDRAALATPREAKVLLSLSRLHPQKGLDTLLSALESLPECFLWLAGQGPLRRELENSAKKRGIIDRVRFLGSRFDHAALLRASDICVLSSRTEPTGDIILEAFAAGTPVVSTASVGALTLIDEGVTGLLTPIGDAKALASAIRRILHEEQLRRTLVSQGYAAYIKEYTRESSLRQWLQFYKSLVK